MADLKALAEELVNLTVKDVNELATILKEEYGIEPAAAAKGTYIKSIYLSSTMSKGIKVDPKSVDENI